MGLALVVSFAGSAPREALADPIETNNYSIDLFQGPLLSPIRQMALGGAIAGYGESIAGLVSNAATPSVRDASSLRHINFDFRASFSFPIQLFGKSSNDLDNSGDLEDDTSDFIFLSAGGMLQIGSFGAGLLSDLQRFSLEDEGGETTGITIGRYRALVGTSFVRGGLAIGAGARALSMTLDTPDADLAYAGAAPEIGVLVRPRTVPFRFGATYRFAVLAQPLEDPDANGTGPARAGPLVLPQQIVQPWELETGIAFQIGPRPLNVPFDDPEDRDDGAEKQVAAARRQRASERHRILMQTPDATRRAAEIALDEREAELVALEDRWLGAEHQWWIERADDAFSELPRERLLVLVSVLASGPTPNGVGLEGFLDQGVPGQTKFQQIGSSGAATNFSPRFGIEAEPLIGRLVLRTGSYYEPSRFGGVGRAHFTFGSELRLFSTDIFGLLEELPYAVELGMDLAPRYESLSASITVFR